MAIDSDVFRRLVAPKSVAVVGASSNLGSYGSRALLNTMRLGFQGGVAAINPRGESCGDVRGYTALAELPWVAEHVAVAVPRRAVEAVVRECAQLGVVAVTVFSNGYGETGTKEGREDQERLATIAADAGIRFFGPNCNGILNIRDRVALTSTRALDDLKLYEKPPGEPGYAVVSQSGGLAVVNVMWRALQAGLPIQWVASTGNQASIGVFEMAEAALDEDDVLGVLVVLEGMPEAAEVVAVGEKAAKTDKFVSCLKLGRSAAGVGAAASHTGAVAGEYASFEALCQQAGIACVEDPSELYESAMVLTTVGGRPLPGGIAMVSISGGNLALMSDAIDSRGLPIATFGTDTQDRLRALLPAMCSPVNPLDLMTAVQDPKIFEGVLNALADDEAVGLCVVVLTLNPPGFLDVVRDAAAKATKPVILAWLGGALTGEMAPEDLRRQGIPVYETASACGNALAAAFRASRGTFPAASPPNPLMEQGSDLPGEVGRGTSGERIATVATSARLPGPGPGEILGGSEALRRMRNWGLEVVEGMACPTAEAAAEAAAQLGFPVVVKIDDPAIVHKTEHDAVRVGIRSAEDCAAVATSLLAAGGTDAQVLVQRQVGDAVELLVAARGGEPPGVTLVVGVGGVLVEVLRDVTFLFPPFVAGEARVALQRLKAYPLFGSFRGQDAVDLDGLAEWLVRFSRAVAPRLVAGGTVEVNPVMVPRGSGQPLIVDAALFGPGSQPARDLLSATGERGRASPLS